MINKLDVFFIDPIMSEAEYEEFCKKANDTKVRMLNIDTVKNMTGLPHSALLEMGKWKKWLTLPVGGTMRLELRSCWQQL